MFRKKFYLTLNLLLGTSFLVTQGLTSCETVKEQFNIFVTQNSEEAGLINIDKTKGAVGETVKIEVELNDGYTVAHIKVNGEIKSEGVTIFEFQPVAGENKVEVVFADENGTVIDPGAKPIKGQFELNIILNGNHGKVEADKLKGKVGENVTVTINPDPGYEIKSVEFNNVQYAIDTRTFTPIEGKNTLKVGFKKTEEVHYDWSLEVTHNEGGVVTPSATQGKIGEKIEIQVTLEPEYIIDKLLFNGKEENVDTRLFTPADGINKLEVQFIHESALSKLDKGFALTGKIEKEHETDIRTNEDFIETLNQLTEFNKAFHFEHGEWEYSVNNHPEFANLPQKTGVTKKELLSADKIVFNGTLKKIADKEYDWTNKEHVKEIVTYFKNVYDNISLPVWYTCVSAFYFGTTVIVNNRTYSFDGYFRNMFSYKQKDYILKHYSHIDGVEEFVNQYNVETILAPKDGNYFDEQLQHDLYILCEFGYKLWGKAFAVTRDVETVAKTIVTLYKFLKTGSFGGYEKDFAEACNLFGELITEGFCNKDSFPVFISAFGFIDNMSRDNVASYDLYDNVCVVMSKYKDIMPGLTNDIHHLYRIFKFIGFIAKEITVNELEFVKILLNNPQDIKYSEAFVYGSKAFMKAYTSLGNEALLVKEAFPKAIEKVNYIFKNVINSAHFISDENFRFSLNNFTNVSKSSFGEIVSTLNIDKILEEVDKASKLDPKALTEENETYYRNFIENELLSKLEIKQDSTTYKLAGNQNYRLNQKLDLTIYKTEQGKETETIKLTEKDVKGFSTTNKKTDALIYSIDNNKDLVVPYNVENERHSFQLTYENDYEQNDSYYLPLNFDGAKVKVNTYVMGENIEIINPEFVGLDKTKVGEQYVAIKYNEQLYFGCLYLYDPKDVLKLTTIGECLNVPLNVEIDLRGKNYQLSFFEYQGIYINEELKIISKKWLYNERSIIGINGTGNTKHTFTKEGLQTLNIQLETFEGSKDLEVSFNVKKPISKKKELTGSDDFYNFIGAKRNEEKLLKFNSYEIYEFGVYCYSNSICLNSHYEISKEHMLKASDFDNDLDYRKVEVSNYGRAIDYYQGLPFEYSVYHLKKEILDSYFIGESHNEFSHMLNSELSDYNIRVNQGTLYVGKDYSSDHISTLFISDDKRHNVKKGTKIDTSSVGEHKTTIEISHYDENSQETIETVEAIYNVVKPIYIDRFDIYINDEISDENSLPDDQVLNAYRESKNTFILPYSENESALYSNEAIKDIKFKDIKYLIDYSYPLYEEQVIEMIYKGEKVKLHVILS